jgi:two-component system NtrC family sensor kinase
MDPDQMQQVFLNLMINAVQAMPDGGTLKITASTSDEEREKDYDKTAELLSGEKSVILEFEDTGKGIESEYLDSIFDPFVTKKSKGTGLGLAISRRIVQEHGGDITVRTEAAKGSTFAIYLPLIEQ